MFYGGLEFLNRDKCGCLFVKYLIYKFRGKKFLGYFRRAQVALHSLQLFGRLTWIVYNVQLNEAMCGFLVTRLVS